MSFTNLKKNSNKSAEQLSQKLAEGTKSYDDPRFWTLETDKAGNGFAIIRFLPEPQGENDPFVKLYSHSFKGPGGWYIENCPTTIGLDCPICQANSGEWAKGTEDAKALVRSRARKTRFISNIYVIKDPANKQNEGKVFLFNYGKKIHDKIIESLNPKFEGEEKINPFDMWSGRNFKVKVKRVADYPNYDDSVFDPSTPFLTTDAEREEVWKKQYSLAEFIAPGKFKSAEELLKRFHKVMQIPAATSTGPIISTGSSNPQSKLKITETPTNEAPPFDSDDETDKILQDLMKE